MLDWFEFAGVRSTDRGVQATKLPPITIAEERVKFEEAIGRSGSLTMLEGDAVYDDHVLAIECRLRHGYAPDAVAAWLRGSGHLVLPNRPGGYYIGRVVDKIEMERIIPARDDRAFTVNIRVQPYWYMDDVQNITMTGTSMVIGNPGTAESMPRIEIHGSGDVGLLIRDQLMLLTDITGGIVIDSELQDALSLDGSELLNEHVAGDFPTLPPGNSTIAWHPFGDNDNPGTVTQIVIAPRWRCR